MTLPDSTCPRCGGPARVVVIHKARVRCELLPADRGMVVVGKVLSASRDTGVVLGFECGGGHKWSELQP